MILSQILTKKNSMHIFFAINNNYTQHVGVAITSILVNNQDSFIHFYIISDGLIKKNKLKLSKLKKNWKNFDITYFNIDTDKFDALKLNISHISKQTYYRYLIPDLVPDLDKALYLDSDLIVNKNLSELWNTNINDFYTAGVKDTYIEKIKYKEKIKFSTEDLYVNAGVLLLNLKKIREDNKIKELFENTKKFENIIEYQDQDIINITFKNKIKEISKNYNYTFCDCLENELDYIKNVTIIHFTGHKKPWNHYLNTGNPSEFLYFKYLQLSPFKSTEYKYKIKHFIFSKKKLGNKREISILGIKFYYKKQEKEKSKKNKIKVALLVDEFFGGAGTAFGGYGFLARHYIAKYIPNDKIQLDCLLCFSKNLEKIRVDNIDVYKLPRDKKIARDWLHKQDYDIFLSIELTSSSYQILKLNKEKKPLILWVQDPRPWYEWREINTVKLFPETCYWDTPVYEYVNYMNWLRKVKFITQGYFLEEKARDLYRLNDDLKMKYVPNPIDIDINYDVKLYPKKNHIVFLGRVESVKRGWLFCEIAKRLPEYEFFMLGQTYREKEKNSSIIDQYKNIKNLHFVGHVEGETKNKYLKDAKILVNTSIHEALPISFLEALSYGTLLVSNRNPEDLTSKFGIHVGNVLGDGFDKVDLYVEAIKKIIKNDEYRKKTSIEATEYIRKIHNVENFIKNIRNLLLNEASQ